MLRLPLAVRTVLATAAIVGLSSYSPVTSVQAAPETPRISWSPCHQDAGRPFECGTVQVPLDHAEPTAPVRFATLAARLRAAPHKIIDPSAGDTIPFSFADLVGTTLGAMYSPRSWPSFAELLAYIEAEVEPALIGAQLVSCPRRM